MSLEVTALRAAWAAWLPGALPELAQENYTAALAAFPRPPADPPAFVRAPLAGQRRIAFVTSAGAYDRETQAPFVSRSAIGDASHRVFPTTLADERMQFEHGHYDDEHVLADREVLVPRRTLVAEGAVLTANIISTMGYALDWPTLIESTIPQLVAQAKSDGANCALLVPV